MYEFQERLRKLQSKNRLNTFKNLVIGFVVLAIFVSIFIRAEAPLERVGFGLWILGTLVLVFPHVVALWNGAQGGDPTELGMTTGLRFYRRLLEPHRAYAKWTAVSLLLIFFGMMLILIPMVSRQIADPNSRVSIRNILPFSLILVTWGVSFVLLRRRQQRWLRRELELLSTLETEHPQS